MDKAILTVGDWWPVAPTEEGFTMELGKIKLETAESNYLEMREAEVERLRAEVIRLTNANSLLTLKVELLEARLDYFEDARCGEYPPDGLGDDVGGVEVP